MKNFSKDFSSFQKHIWLNAASEGPLPKVAVKSLKEAIRWKSRPYELTNEKFAHVPQKLKDSIGRLIGVSGRDVILANSASYGLHILANGIPWQAGDEIILMQNDFPTNIVPWLALAKKGVIIRQVLAKDKALTPDELRQSLSPRTRLFCISHVHTFTGIKLDIEEFSKICREKKILFILNITQSAGTMPLDFSKIPVNAVVSTGYKWLCGPYGVGFCWIHPELRNELQLNQAYWLAASSDEELKKDIPIQFREIESARKYDVFCTANFFNFVPFQAAIDYWLNVGLDQVQTYNDRLIDFFIERLDKKRYFLISPSDGKSRSNLVVISHQEPGRNMIIFQALKTQKIHLALWKGNLRISPHVYNSRQELLKLIKSLHRLGQ